MKRFYWLGVLLFANSLAFAQGGDLKGSKDHPLISRFAGSSIIGYEAKEFDEFRLPLGKQIRDSKKKIVLSKSRKLEGKITRVLYKAPDKPSTLSVYRNYRKALKEAGFEILFNWQRKSADLSLNMFPLLKNTNCTNTP